MGQPQIYHWSDNQDGTISLRSLTTGLFVCAENAGASPLIANRTTAGPWEKFAPVLAYQPPIVSNVAVAGNNLVVSVPMGCLAALTKFFPPLISRCQWQSGPSAPMAFLIS
ncbi:MAG: hypothetical protein QM813_24590 [Verrucomicrobiota bacterium]